MNARRLPPLRVDPGQITMAVKPNAVGLNVNFLADHAESRQRGQGYVAALRRMGVRSLRYPGGEKSNEYLWSSPPWDAPRPRLGIVGPKGRLHLEGGGRVDADGRFLVKPMDFDEFMEICRAVGAHPIVCVNLGAAYVKDETGGRRGTPHAEVMANAVEWVRYANRVKGYGVRDWELGNESYWRGSAAAIGAADYTRDAIEFSRAMKAVDPGIRFGVNGHVGKSLVSPADGEGGPIWWQHLLSRASAEIDFAVMHPYPCYEWGSYDYYRTHAPGFTEGTEEVAEAIRLWAPAADAARLRIQATEANAFDWAASHWYRGTDKGWAWANDLGHAVVLFDILGQHLAHPLIDGIQVWTTRWFDSPSRLEDVIDEDNNLLPTGEAVGLWGRHLKENLATLAGLACGPAYAAWSPRTKELALFLVNKGREALSVEVELAGHSGEWRATGERFCGESETDLHPEVLVVGSLGSADGKIVCDLPPMSITVLELRPRGA
ncbi:MAG: hypothetical protein AAB152_09840 [Candidatus Coatesbacteria bacterium]